MTDHKAEADKFLEVASMEVSENMIVQTGEHKADVLAAAQVHATLYLAEQQRVANLIAVSNLELTKFRDTGRGSTKGILVEVVESIWPGFQDDAVQS